MRISFQCLTGLLLAMVAMLSMAASPRFTGRGTETESGVPVNTAQSAQLAATAPPAAATDTGDAAAAPAASDPPAAQVQVEAPVKPQNEAADKKSGGSFWDWFRRKDKPTVEDKTVKQPAQLVNTEKYHQPTYELLGQGDLHRYEAGLDTPWHVHASSMMCVLRQTIPQYGNVEFRQGVGQALEFALYVNHPPAGTGKAHVRVAAPRWQHYAADRDLGILELESGNRVLTASTQWSRRLLLELSDGMQPMLRYWDAADATDDMEVMLSAINFRSSLALFHTCLGQLLKYDTENVQRIVVNFNEDSSKLRSQATQQLDDVLEIYRNDKRITQVELEVYTHRTGLERYNFRLATRRTRAVRDYLIKRGVDEDKLLIKVHTKQKEELDKLGYRPTDVHIVLTRDKPATTAKK